ncbi:complement component receptor 1-like protein isoform X2 [Hemicordylus capensis]|uniref:complement component receptor 1-like protein isoform X2 n=1 Tax=Hemicordylus capensis TaxID=884348 RepID=UPI0023021351|nr:complement component receptor 1-like protein isoform X2 [Hemicordylus capensis]
MVPLPCCHIGPFMMITLLLLFLSKAEGDCNRPELIPHAELRSGELKDSYPIGTTLTYRCIPGYELIRGIIPRITCTGTSTWSPEAPQFCQGKRCPPPDLENGRVTTSTDYRLGAEITFTCDFGFRLIGRNSARCTLADGVVAWDYQGPLCQRIPCFPPPEIDNGSSDYDGSRDYDYGQVATYTCQPSFTLIGSKNLVCTTKDALLTTVSPTGGENNGTPGVNSLKERLDSIDRKLDILLQTIAKSCHLQAQEEESQQ